MVVMILEAVPVGLRGELTRWLTQVAATVFRRPDQQPGPGGTVGAGGRAR